MNNKVAILIRHQIQKDGSAPSLAIVIRPDLYEAGANFVGAEPRQAGGEKRAGRGPRIPMARW